MSVTDPTLSTPAPPPVPPLAGAGVPSGGPTPPERPGRRSAIGTVLLAGLLVALLGLVVLLVLDDDDRSARALPVDPVPVTPSTTVTAPSSIQAGADAGAFAGADATGSPAPDAPRAPSAPPAPAPADPVPAPAVTSIAAPSVFTCSDAPDAGTATQLTLRWTTTGAQSVTVAIDSPAGAFASGLPSGGSLTVPAPCAPDSNTYYVTAVAADGSVATSSTTTSGR